MPTHLSVLLIALLAAASVCDTTARDILASELITAVHLEPAHQVVRRQADQALRVFIHYDSSVTVDLPAAKRTTIQDDVLPRLTAFLQQTLAVTATQGPILLDRNCTTPAFFPPTGGSDIYRRCVEQCQPVTRCGTVEVPQEHLKRCVQCNGGGSTNCEMVGTDGSGVSNADFILYVSARDSECPTSNGGPTTLAFAGACQMESSLDRPIAGSINFCPAGFTDTSNEFIFSVTKHEMLHALAFARSLFPFWRDDQGDPRTPRDADGLPPIMNGFFQWSSTTIRSVTYQDWQTRSGTVPHSVLHMLTPRVLEEARAHFNCTSLQGVELENQGGGGTAFSHWEKRILGNEAMTGQFTFNPIFSRITFAALEDSGWYRVNYSMAGDFVWGRDSGCRFATGSCGEWIQTQQTNNRPITPFCNRLRSQPSRLSCTLDRGAVSICNLVQFTSALPAEYQYFNNGTNFGSDVAAVVGGSVTVADFCPFQEAFNYQDGRGTNCTNTTNSPSINLFAETYASESRCVEHGRQWTWTAGQRTATPTTYGGGCYQYECSASGVVIYLLGQGFSCTCEGEELVFDLTVSGARYEGSIICPSCAQICHDDLSSCPDPEPASCYGRVTTAQPTTPPSSSTQPMTPPSSSTQPMPLPSSSTQPMTPPSSNTQPMPLPSLSTQSMTSPSSSTQPTTPPSSNTQPMTSLSSSTQPMTSLSSSTQPMPLPSSSTQPMTLPPSSTQPVIPLPSSSQPMVPLPSSTQTLPPSSTQPVIPLPSSSQPMVPLPSSTQPMPLPSSSTQPMTSPSSSTQPMTSPPSSTQPSTLPTSSTQPSTLPTSSTQPSTLPTSSTQPSTLPTSSTQPMTLPPTSSMATSLPPVSTDPTSGATAHTLPSVPSVVLGVIALVALL